MAYETVLVYGDAESAKKLSQPLDDKWNRALHGALLERLTRDGTRLLFYDTPSLDPTKDEAFAGALQGFGRAVARATLEIVQPRGEVKQERVCD